MLSCGLGLFAVSFVLSGCTTTAPHPTQMVEFSPHYDDARQHSGKYKVGKSCSNHFLQVFRWGNSGIHAALPQPPSGHFLTYATFDRKTSNLFLILGETCTIARAHFAQRASTRAAGGTETSEQRRSRRSEGSSNEQVIEMHDTHVVVNEPLSEVPEKLRGWLDQVKYKRLRVQAADGERFEGDFMKVENGEIFLINQEKEVETMSVRRVRYIKRLN